MDIDIRIVESVNRCAKVTPELAARTTLLDPPSGISKNSTADFACSLMQRMTISKAAPMH